MPCFISHKYELMFCHIPRTAGTSFTEAIKPYLGPDDEIDTYPKHYPLRKFRIGRLGKHFDDYLKVCIWRDWPDRLKSLEMGARKDGYVGRDSDYFWDNEKWLCERDKMLADIMIAFDQLPDSAIKFFKLIGIELEEFPHLNSRTK